jgi:hypothetical protein
MVMTINAAKLLKMSDVHINRKKIWGETHGIGSVRRTMVTVLPRATALPAAGDWLKTQEWV